MLYIRFWWLKIDCLAGMSDWTELDKFAKSKKSPIGYEVRWDAVKLGINASLSKNFV